MSIKDITDGAGIYRKFELYDNKNDKNVLSIK